MTELDLDGDEMVETGCRIGNVEKNLQDRSFMRIDNDVRFAANNTLEYD